MSVHRGYCLQNLKVSAGSQIFLAGLAQTSNCPALPAGSRGRPQRRGRGTLLQLCSAVLSQAPGPVRSWTLVVALLGPSAHATWADKQAEREITGERTRASEPASHTATSQLRSPQASDAGPISRQVNTLKVTHVRICLLLHCFQARLPHQQKMI